MKKLAAKPSPDHWQSLLSLAGKATPGNSAVDLMIAATASGPNLLPTLETPLTAILRPKGLAADATAKIESQLRELTDQHHQDFSAHVALTLFALKGSYRATADAALARLAELVAANPLEDVPSGKRANARQRAEAAPQIGLWLIARECLSDSSRKLAAEPLVGRAIAAAQRQLDTSELTAIMYERGKLAMAAGDRALAEKCWNELIDLALVEPQAPPSGHRKSAC